jgi:Fur family peroxide stress response transcriptional regulator
MENYIIQLREHNLKATPQRAAITEALDIYGHLSIENLYELLKKKFHSLSLATVYKNVHIMVENSFVSEVKLPHRKSVYELTKEAHSHLLCEKCGMIEDIILDLDEAVKSAKDKTDFEIKSVNFVLSGICKKCQ